MPAYAAKIRGKWRVVHGHPPRVELNQAGTAVDGGGHTSRHQAEAQARAINARQGGYPPRPARANPITEKDVKRVWICEDGQVLVLSPSKDWWEQVPDDLAVAWDKAGGQSYPRGGFRESFARFANHHGYWRGGVINERLYVIRDAAVRPVPAAVLSKLKTWCAGHGCTRGLVVE